MNQTSTFDHDALSVIIPAYNEEKNIKDTLSELKTALSTLAIDYEIIVVNDCSSDRTSDIVEEFSKTFPGIRLSTNSHNLGFGGSFKRGVQLATKKYCIMVCGDNGIGAPSLARIFSKLGQAQVVTSWTSNTTVRSKFRRLLSWLYVKIINTTFGLHLKYYNGHNIFPTKELQAMEFTPSFAYATEIVVRLLKKGYTVLEVPFELKVRVNGETSAFRLKNIIQVAKTFLHLFLDVYFVDAHQLPDPSQLDHHA